MSASTQEERRRQRAKRQLRSGDPSWAKEHTHELFRLYKEEGDEEARQELIVNHLNLVRFIAGKFANRGEPLDDLVQVGTLGLIKAIDRFEPDRGLEFTTFATPTIMGEIKRHFRDKGWSVRVPRRLQELSAKINTTTDDLTAELQRSPTVREVAERLGVTVDEVLEAMESSSAYSSVPLEGIVPEEREESASVIEQYATVDRDLANSDDRMILDEAIATFAPRDQELLRMRFKEGLTQAEIAEQLGVSQEQVSRLLRKLLKSMQEQMGPGRK